MLDDLVAEPEVGSGRLPQHSDLFHKVKYVFAALYFGCEIFVFLGE